MRSGQQSLVRRDEKPNNVRRRSVPDKENRRGIWCDLTQNLDASLEPCRCSGNLRQVTVCPKSLVHFHYIGNEREGELGVTKNTNIGGPHGTFSSEDGLTLGIDERFQRRVFVPLSFETHVKVLGPGHSRCEWDHLAPQRRLHLSQHGPVAAAESR